MELSINGSDRLPPPDALIQAMIEGYLAGQPKPSPPDKHLPPSQFRATAVGPTVILSAVTDLGTVGFTLHISNPTAPAAVNFQIFLHRIYAAPDGTKVDEWVQIVPTDAAGGNSFNVFPNLDNVFTFSSTAVPLGNYTEARVIGFTAGSNFSQNVLDAMATGLNLSVTTTQIRVTKPQIVVDTASVQLPGPDGKMHIPFTIKFPDGYVTQYSGLFAMAKGSGGAVQPWEDLTKAVIATGPDPCRVLTSEFVLDVPANGLYNLQFGLFNYGWTLLQWVYPGMDFEVGGDAWVVKCPAANLPPRLTIVGGQWQTLDSKAFDWCPSTAPLCCSAVAFVRGGNYGNALTWTNNPDYNTPGFFSVLRFKGLRWIRTNFDPDKYLASAAYQHSVDQVVQNQLSGGLYPIIGPQNMPTSSAGEADRDAKHLTLIKALATKYNGLPVWLNLCNEPSNLATWAQCKPVMEAAAQAVRAIDPQAFVICPFNGYSTGSTADAAASPITSVHIDLLDYHAYNAPDVFAQNTAPALAAGLPVLVGEYGGGDAAYLNSMDIAFQKAWIAHKSLMGAGPWAFTHMGQDSLPLVADGSGAVVTFTPSGQQVIADYALWDAGTLLPLPVPPPPPPPPPLPPPVLTTDQQVLVRKIMVEAMNARLIYISDTLKHELASSTFGILNDVKAFLARLITILHP